MLAHFYYDLRYYKNAKEILERYLALNGDNWEAWKLFGAVHLALGNIV
jgi:tetratricopeptide (TPR) repeat protein